MVLDFNEKHIAFRNISDDSDLSENLTTHARSDWDKGEGSAIYGYFSKKRLYKNKVLSTITTSKKYHSHIPRVLNSKELKKGSSFPMDYKANGNHLNFLIGMSVPPLMIANISLQIKEQWLDTQIEKVLKI